MQDENTNKPSNSGDSGSNSMKFVTLAVAAIVILAIGVVVWMVFGQQDDSTSTDSSTETSQSANEVSDTPATTDDEATTATAPKSVEIVFTDDGFAKSEYTVAKGGTVTVKNESSTELQFSSDDHPTHTENSELNLTTLAAGESTAFTPETAGTWGIHDHIQSQFTTNLVVQ